MTLQEAVNVALGVLELMEGDDEGFSNDQRNAIGRLIHLAQTHLAVEA